MANKNGQYRNPKNSGKRKGSKGNGSGQPRKDSDNPRVNFDNTREDKFDKDVAKDFPHEKMSKPNDINWYTKNEEMLKAAASFNVSNTVGLPIGFDLDDGYIQTPMGVMGIYFYPHLGPSGYAVNTAKDSYYSDVVHANSRNTSYSADDLMIITLAGKDVFAAISNAVRAYGLMKTYDQRNTYLPRAVITAMGFDFQDLKNNLAQMWFDINDLIIESRQIWIPNVFPVIDRGIWLNQNVYQDAEGVKSQKYVFVQKRYWIYNDTLTDQGGGLEWVKDDNGKYYDFELSGTGATFINTTKYTWVQYRSMVRKMITALMNSTYRGVMMGDVYKAFGAEKLFALNPISSDYRLDPVYDSEVLMQIENSTCCNTIYSKIVQNQTTKFLNMTWDPIPSGVTVWNLPMWKNLMNFHFPTQPTPAEVMIATRLKCMGVTPIYTSSNTLVNVSPRTCGTEVVYSYGVFWMNSLQEIWSCFYATVLSGITESTTEHMIQASFDWCPWIYDTGAKFPVTAGMTRETFESYSFQPKFAIGDYDNYTVMSNNELDKMHVTAAYSEYDVPIL